MDDEHIPDACYLVCVNCNRPFLREKKHLVASEHWMLERFPPSAIQPHESMEINGKKPAFMESLPNRAKKMGTISEDNPASQICKMYERCSCYDYNELPVNNHEREEKMTKGVRDWLESVVFKQVDKLNQKQKEVNIIFSHRHHYSKGGEKMHVSLFPPNFDSLVKNRWDFFLPFFGMLFQKLGEKVPSSTTKNIYVGSSEGPYIGLTMFRETMILMKYRDGQNIPFDFENVRLVSIVDDKYEYFDLPSSMSKEKLSKKGFMIASRAVRQCEFVKKNGERCNNRQKHAFCWRHN